jgi:tetratricopeptide (TPR) repeat protein
MEFFDKLRYDEWFYESDRHIKEGKFADAMQTLESIVAEEPRYGKAHNHLGWLYETRYYNYKKAEEHYKACIENEPEYTPVYLNLAVVLSGQHKWEELTDLLNRALDTPGVDKASCYNEMGIMMELQERYDEAISAYRTAVRMSMRGCKVDQYIDSIGRCKIKKQFFKNEQ